jgi:hypothetical protein
MLDWREVRPEGSAAQALFPCKPSSQTRRIELAGAAMEMTIHACDVSGTTYAFASADLADPARVALALRELGGAAARNLAAAAPAASAAMQVPGMTPNPLAQRLRLDGQRPDGTAVHEELALFARGTRVYQATMIGVRLDAEAVDTFFGALRVAP